MKLILDRPKDLVDPCPECLPEMDSNGIDCDNCKDSAKRDEYLNKLVALHIILDQSKTYIFHEGKCYEVPKRALSKPMLTTYINGTLGAIESLPEVK